MTRNQQRTQRVKGYLFAVLALLMVGVSIVAFWQRSTLNGILPLVMVVFFGYLSWKQLQPDRDEPLPTADERTRQTIQSAGYQAFLVLMIVMVLQSMFHAIPAQFLTSGYLLLGAVIYGSFWAYYRWRGLAR